MCGLTDRKQSVRFGRGGGDRIWLRGFRTALCLRKDSRSLLLGPCAQEILRFAGSTSIAGGNRSAGTNRGSLCRRERYPRTNAGRTPRDPQCAESPATGIAETMVRTDLGQAIEKIGYDAGGSLRTRTMGSPDALLR